MPTAESPALHAAPHAAPHAGGLRDVIGDEYVLVLAPRPGDESLACGGLIAQACRRGRPPMVMVLSDGTSSHAPSAEWPSQRRANLHDRETRRAVAALGLDEDRLLMAGLIDGTLPAEGDKLFEAVVRAVVHVMWRMDCNVVCAPAADSPDALHRVAHRVAAVVASRSGVGRVAYAGPGWSPPGADAPSPVLHNRVLPNQAPDAVVLDVSHDLPRKRDAILAHASLTEAADGAASPVGPALLARSLAASETYLKLR